MENFNAGEALDLNKLQKLVDRIDARGSNRTMRITVPEDGPVTWSWAALSVSTPAAGKEKA